MHNIKMWALLLLMVGIGFIKAFNGADVSTIISLVVLPFLAILEHYNNGNTGGTTISAL